jgi:hypothetical protein
MGEKEAKFEGLDLVKFVEGVLNLLFFGFWVLLVFLQSFYQTL